MNTIYLIIEVENGSGSVMEQAYSLEDAKKTIKTINENTSWKGYEKKHIYVPINIATLSLTTPKPMRDI